MATAKKNAPVALTDRDLVIEALKAALAVLEGGAAVVEDVEAEEVEETPRKGNSLKSRTKKADVEAEAPKRRTKKVVEPEPEEDEDDDDESDERTAREEELNGLGVRALRGILRDDFGWTAAEYKGMDVDSLVDEIITAEFDESDEDDDDEDDDEDEDDDDDPTVIDDDEDDEDDDDEDEDEDEDDEDEDYDPDSMTDAEVRAVAKKYNIDVKGLKGAKLRAAVFSDDDE